MRFRSSQRIAIVGVLGASLLFAQGYDIKVFSFPFPDTSPPRWNGIYATSINYQGVIVGTFYHQDPDNKSGYIDRGFKRYPNGHLEYPFQHPDAQGKITNLVAINDVGEIAGFFLPSPTSLYQGFVYKNGVYSTIPLGRFTRIEGMNNLGDLTGTYGPPAGRVQGFTIRSGILSLLGPADRNIRATTATDIAADGTVVGNYLHHGFLRGPRGNYLRIKVRDALYTSLYGINNTAGKIVGSYVPSGGGSGRAFVYDYRADLASVDVVLQAQDNGPAGAPVKQIDVVPLNTPECVNMRAYDINARGVVVGRCQKPNSQVRGFIATPK